MKEQNIQRLIMLSTANNGSVIFRNNCGAYTTPDGYRVKYGVGNPGGSDLIGITPIVITDDMVGRTMGIFTAIEVKTKTGKPSPNQLNFIDVIKNNGGIAGVCRSSDDADDLIKSFLK